RAHPGRWSGRDLPDAVRPWERTTHRWARTHPSSACSGRSSAPCPPARGTVRPTGGHAWRRARAGPAGKAAPRRCRRPRTRWRPRCSSTRSVLGVVGLFCAGLHGLGAFPARTLATRPAFGVPLSVATLLLLSSVVTTVCVDDLPHQLVPDHVLAAELAERDVVDVVQDVFDGAQATALTTRQVHLGDVTGHHDLGTETQTGQEHLHLLGRGVLCLVQDDEGVVDRIVCQQE